MLYVGGGKNIRIGAACDCVLEQTRGAVFGFDLDARRTLKRLGSLVEWLAQAARRVEMN